MLDMYINKPFARKAAEQLALSGYKVSEQSHSTKPLVRIKSNVDPITAINIWRKAGLIR